MSESEDETENPEMSSSRQLLTSSGFEKTEYMSRYDKELKEK